MSKITEFTAAAQAYVRAEDDANDASFRLIQAKLKLAEAQVRSDNAQVTLAQAKAALLEVSCKESAK